MAAAVIVPVVAIVFLLDLLAFQEASRFDPETALYEVGDSVRALDESRYVILSTIQSVVAVIGYLLVVGAIFRALSEAYLGQTPDARASIEYAVRRMHSLLWLSLLFVLGAGIGFLLLVLPGIYLLVAWSVAVPVLMVERVRGAKALGRSFGLVRHNWWRTFGTLLVGFIVIGLFNLLLALVASAADGVARDSVYLWAFIYDLVSGLSTVITAPLQAAIITVIYYDLRVRKEGFDIALLSAGLGAAPVPASTGPLPADAPTPTPESAPPATLVAKDHVVDGGLDGPEMHISSLDRLQAAEAWDTTGIGDAELATARRFLERRDQFAPHVRSHLADDLAARLRPKVPGSEAIGSGEQFIELLVAVKSQRG